MGKETEFDEKGGSGAVEDESHSRVTVRRSRQWPRRNGRSQPKVKVDNCRELTMCHEQRAGANVP